MSDWICSGGFNSLRPIFFLHLLSLTAKLTINILDVNDNAPRFRPFGATFFTERILEGATPGTTLISVSAVDPDKGANGQITYELLSLSPEGYVQLEDVSAGWWGQYAIFFFTEF